MHIYRNYECQELLQKKNFRETGITSNCNIYLYINLLLKMTES